MFALQYYVFRIQCLVLVFSTERLGLGVLYSVFSIECSVFSV